MARPKKKKTPAKTRRGRGEGCPQQRPNGRWYAQLSMGGSGKGRKRRTFSGRSKNEVLDRLAQARGDQVNGILPEPDAITTGDWLDHWSKSKRAASDCGATGDYYEKNIRNHLRPTLGEIRLQKLKAADIEAALNQIAGLSLRKKNLTIVNMALKAAKRQNLIAVNPADTVTRPRPPKMEIHPFSRDEAAAFLKSIAGDEAAGIPPAEFWQIFAVALGTGARQGEILGAKWEDIDLAAKTWQVRRTITEAGKKISVKETKTKAGRRKIILDDRSLAALIDQKRAAMKSGAAGQPWVFCEPDGAWIDRHAVIRAFRRAVKAAGLPTIRFHDLRHTSATLLLLAGVHVKIVSERLGHSSIAITLDTYSHCLPVMQEDAVDKLNKLLA